jgi:hypothetical protein
LGQRLAGKLLERVGTLLLLCGDLLLLGRHLLLPLAGDLLLSRNLLLRRELLCEGLLLGRVAEGRLASC